MNGKKVGGRKGKEEEGGWIMKCWREKKKVSEIRESGRLGEHTRRQVRLRRLETNLEP